MVASNVYKEKRNKRIVELHDVEELSLRAIARRMHRSVEIIHRAYWCQKLRDGQTDGVPARILKQFSYLIEK